ncbi:MAG: tRNA adenosine(34) deaminase TadA [Succinivibrio sp.]|nr:tRNA adenosine(34) deaminase TadA [Succinivibrio sp.]
MTVALAQARLAWDLGEVPVGAVVTDGQGRILGVGCNRVISSHDPSAHAEMVALRAAGRLVHNYRLPGLSLYVTLEPCLMCTGLMVHSRIEYLYYGASDPKTGACGGCFALADDPRHNHHLKVQGGVLAEQCSALLRAFFKYRREQQRQGATSLV